MSWWLWTLVGVLALAGESISMALFLLYVAIAAFVAALLALLHLGVAAQVGVFVVLSLLLIGLVRPRMLHALAGRVPHRALTNQGRLVDRLATVTQTVTSDGGMVRVGNAEFWTACVTLPTPRIEVGSSVRIVYVDGLTAYVEPMASIPEVAPAPGPPRPRHRWRTRRASLLYS
jgi:membrane protein implicated in regulation of membrane protease activity